MTSAIAALIKNGAKVHERDEHGKTPLMAACCAHVECNSGAYERAKVVEQLYNAGASLSSYDSTGATALHHAVSYRKNFPVVQSLLKIGVQNFGTKGGIAIDVNARDKNGMTPLMTAALRTGEIEVMELLINAGAQVNAESDRLSKVGADDFSGMGYSNLTAMHFLFLSGRHDTAEAVAVLVRYGGKTLTVSGTVRFSSKKLHEILGGTRFIPAKKERRVVIGRPFPGSPTSSVSPSPSLPPSPEREENSDTFGNINIGSILVTRIATEKKKGRSKKGAEIRAVLQIPDAMKGGLLGAKGVVIAKLKRDTKTRIRIDPTRNFHPWARVRVEGNSTHVKKAEDAIRVITSKLARGQTAQSLTKKQMSEVHELLREGLAKQSWKIE
eukprot:g3217.t1